MDTIDPVHFIYQYYAKNWQRDSRLRIFGVLGVSSNPDPFGMELAAPSSIEKQSISCWSFFLGRHL